MEFSHAGFCRKRQTWLMRFNKTVEAVIDTFDEKRHLLVLVQPDLWDA